MQNLLCRFLGHDIMRTSNLHRSCVRCGQKEKLRYLGNVEAWVVTDSNAPPEPATDQW